MSARPEAGAALWPAPGGGARWRRGCPAGAGLAAPVSRVYRVESPGRRPARDIVGCLCVWGGGRMVTGEGTAFAAGVLK